MYLLTDTLRGKAQVRTKAASGMFVWKRLVIVKWQVDEYGLQVDVTLIASEEIR